MAGHNGPAKRSIEAGDAQSAANAPRVTAGFGALKVSTPTMELGDNLTLYGLPALDNMGISLWQ